MSAVMEAREPSANYLSALQPPLVQHFELMATAPDGVAKLRDLILTLAVQGKLVPQDTDAESANETLERSRVLMRERMLNGAAKKEKPPAVVTDDEVPFSLPSGWQWCRLTDTGEYVNGLAFKASDFLSDGLPVIRIQNLSGRSADFNRVKGDFPASVLVKAGDILVSWSATLDAFIWRGEVGVLNQHIFRVEPSPAVDKGYLYWLLKWAIRDLAASDHAHGLVMSHINRGPFLSKPIGLPSLAEQARIVSRVEELMRLCDALEAKGQLEAAQHAQLVQTLLGALTASTSPDELADNWQRVASHFDSLLDRPEAIDALEQTILQLAVRGLLVPQGPKDEPASELLKKIRAEKDRLIAEGKIKRDKPLPTIEEIPFTLPCGWTWTRLGVVGESFTYGSSQKASDDASAVPILRMGNIQGGKVLMGNLKYLKDLQDELPSLLLEKGDVLFNRTNSYELVGKTGIFPGDDRPVTFASYLIRIRFMEQFCSPEYANLYMNTSDCRANEIEPDLTQQTGQANYNGTKLRNIRFPLPPREEQSRIVTRVESLRRLCADLRQRLAARQTTHAHLAEALIDEVA